jgi:hypothetical protein
LSNKSEVTYAEIDAPHGHDAFLLETNGAAAKASTLLNAAKIEQGWLEFIADGSIEKQGRRMPIKGFPIVSPTEMLESNPTDVLIFPWNISSEIASLIREVSPKSIRIWQAVPNLREIE